MNSPELLTIQEAAKVLRLTVSTLRAWRQKRKIAFRKIGGKVLIHRDDLNRFIAQATIPAKVRV